MQDYQVLVLAEGETPAAVNNARGHIFEAFIARLMHQFGFDAPTLRDLNVTSEGIELDVSLGNSFTNGVAFAEGKAYTTNVKAQALTSFYGKLGMERHDKPDAHGYLFALPKLTADGDEKARAVEKNDPRFHYLDAQRIADHLASRGLIRHAQSVLPDAVIPSDPALIVTEEGLYSCVKALNSRTRRAERILIWAASPKARIPEQAIRLLGSSDYGIDLPIEDLEANYSSAGPENQHHEVANPPVIVTVRGSSSDFEYQFPASPSYFVGRRAIVAELEKVVTLGKGIFILNAQSGWGKSSLALKFKSMVEDRDGVAAVIDSRTASSPAFVVEALRFAAGLATAGGLLTPPAASSWASLSSAVATIQNADWHRSNPLLIFFDQFENVFLDEATTRQFRDLALLVRELSCNLLIGFAWKTDLVGWTESHPYRLRDDIRSVSTHIAVDLMGAKDIEALLRRLEKRLSRKLARDLRQRLREYSQGLPWLFKKLAEHVIREVEEHGKSQEQLVNEALNVQSLFDSDLAGLQPIEYDALKYVARWAPVSTVEITERYDGGIIQSLLDRRLVVPVGEKLDTYWDIFRDFLNTGQIPLEESYTIGVNPQAAAPVLTYVIESGGESPFADIASAVGTSVGSVINIARTLRLLGISTYEAYGIYVHDLINDSVDLESSLRRVVARTLRRHKAYSLFVRIAERQGEKVPLALYSADLPQAFPAVDAKPSTWSTYARAFALWFEYAGLAELRDSALWLPGEGFTGAGSLLSHETRPTYRTGRRGGRSGSDGRHYSLSGSPGASLQLLGQIRSEEVQYQELGRAGQRAARNLLALQLIEADTEEVLRVRDGVFIAGQLNEAVLLQGLRQLPGGSECLRLLEKEPGADALAVGSRLRDACGANWSDSTAALNGKHFRSWSRQAGLSLSRR